MITRRGLGNGRWVGWDGRSPPVALTCVPAPGPAVTGSAAQAATVATLRGTDGMGGVVTAGTVAVAAWPGLAPSTAVRIAVTDSATPNSGRE